MFLLHPSIFIWDFLILLSFSVFLSLAMGCTFLLRRKQRKIGTKFFGELAGGLCALAACTIFYSAFIEPKTLVVTEKSIDLPIVQTLKIAVISDLHVGPYKNRDFIEKIVTETNRLLPDFVFLVGDFISTEEANVANLLPLRNLRSSAGVFAVLGNHDQGRHRTFFGANYSRLDRGEEISTYMQSLGINVLRNEHTIISLGTEELVLAGIDDLWTGNGDVAESLLNAPEQLATILLSHNPSVIDDADALRADLIVSGHTHGGQIRLPFYGPIRNTPISINQSFDQGVFLLERNRTLAITRGVGETWARARLLAWPEILLLSVDRTE